MTTMLSIMDVPAVEARDGAESHLGAGLALSEILDEQEIEAGVLLILACAAGCSFARMWNPGMNAIPHSGCLPREECHSERSLALEVDETFHLNGRPWLTLK